jgi:hypothetical protein
MSPGPVTSASTIAVMASFRVRSRPGSQDTSHFRLSARAGRAVWLLRSLLMLPSPMVSAMTARPSRAGSGPL